MATPLRVTPDYVAETFGEKYYKILANQPNDLYQFYHCESRMVRVDGDDVNTAFGVMQIRELLTSLNFISVKMEKINSATLNGNVVVFLVGSVKVRGVVGMRNFVQTVTLVPQHKSFYVLSDIFQFLDVIVKQPNLASESLIIIDE